MPYGEKTREQILTYTDEAVRFLLDQGADAIVLACNTATSVAAATLRDRYPLPIIGMEPAVKPAAAATRSGVVGVLATTGTLKSAKFAALLDRFAADVRVITQPCPGLVEQIEAGELNSPRTRALLQGWVEPLLAEGCDTLILGCTHYPFIKPLLRELVPASVSLVDTGAAVARRLEQLLAERGLLAAEGEGGAQFWCSAAPEQLARVLPALWGEAPAVLALP